MIRETSDLVFQISVILGVEGPFDMERFERLAIKSGLAEAYSEAYQNARDRLLRCQELLREGNRREAWAVATAEPDLRKEVGLLNFPQRQKWVDSCGLFGVTVEAGRNRLLS